MYSVEILRPIRIFSILRGFNVYSWNLDKMCLPWRDVWHGSPYRVSRQWSASWWRSLGCRARWLQLVSKFGQCLNCWCFGAGCHDGCSVFQKGNDVTGKQWNERRRNVVREYAPSCCGSDKQPTSNHYLKCSCSLSLSLRLQDTSSPTPKHFQEESRYNFESWLRKSPFCPSFLVSLQPHWYRLVAMLPTSRFACLAELTSLVNVQKD